MKKMKTAAAIVLAVMMLMGAAGCDEVSDAANSIVTEATEDEMVKGVKNAFPEAYPDITYDEAFRSFFSYPSWRHFVGTRNGPDDDGDGQPDYVEENVDVVEFTGNCIYSDTQVKALIQFEIDDDMFSPVFCSFNKVPQNRLMMNGLIMKAFETASEQKTRENGGDNDQPEETGEYPEPNEPPAFEEGEVVDCDINGHINTHGGTVSGYKTSYVVDGGKRATVRKKLGNGWHINAVRYCYAKDIVWYELYDADDGDYYGWVDSDYIVFDE